jgi:hypothetical protein
VKPQSALFGAAGAAALAASLAALPAAAPAPVSAATPPPTPPPITQPAAATPTPIPIPTGYGLPGNFTAPSAHPSSTPSPGPNDRKGIEGAWELEVQRGSSTTYEHIVIKQSGTSINGTFLDPKGKRFPLVGTVEGQSIRMIVTLPDGTTMLLEGRLEGTTDILGMLTTAQEQVPFTAAYRPKEKFIDNISPAAGGMGGAPGGAGGGGGGGGYTPPQ